MKKFPKFFYHCEIIPEDDGSRWHRHQSLFNKNNVLYLFETPHRTCYHVVEAVREAITVYDISSDGRPKLNETATLQAMDEVEDQFLKMSWTEIVVFLRDHHAIQDQPCTKQRVWA